MKIPLAHNDFGPDEGEQKANEKKRTLRKMGTPVGGFAWKFIVCCLVIDISAWAYFNFVKKVPLFTGLQKIQDQIRAGRVDKRAKENQQKITSSRIEPTQKLSALPIPLPEEKRESQKSIAGAPNKDKTLEGRIEHQKQEENRTVTEDNTRTLQGKYSGVVYSYTNKEGRKIYSNIGFPKDEPYSEPRVLRH